MATGGPWESITLNNRRFPVDGEAAVKLSLPGFISEVKPLGDGKSNRIEMMAKSGKAKAIPIIIDHDNNDLQFIQEIMNSGEFVSFNGTTVAGVVWEGDVMISGDPEVDEKTTIMEIEVHGNITKQGGA